MGIANEGALIPPTLRVEAHDNSIRGPDLTHATLALRAFQQTALTPRLQQSVRLLQLSTSDFTQELEQALVSNPFLETPQASVRHASPSTDGSIGRDSDTGVPATSVDGRDPFRSTLASQAGSLLVEEALSSPDDHTGVPQYDAQPSDPTGFPEVDGRAFDAAHADLSAWAEASTTLRMHLHAELAAYRLEARDRTIAEMVIEAIDDDGYLRQDLADVADHFAFDPPVSAHELDIALRLVQQLGPAGIAARGVAECLALQLEARATRPTSNADGAHVAPIALRIVRDHLDLMAARDWPALQRELDAAPADVARAADLIRSLDPRPGSAFGGEVARAVVPDVIVRRDRGGWFTDINPAVIPKVCLNRTYVALFNESRGNDRQPLGQQLQEARWLLRNAAQRFVTIRRVARAIVAEQAAFLEYGDIAIRPLLLRQVADTLGLHESTISRAIGNKFMATPRGVFAFKHFFSRKLATVSGGSCSATSIRAAMRDLIDREDRAEPLSDVVLAKALTGQGLCVARRTVTKYRGLMRIPPLEMRREPP